MQRIKNLKVHAIVLTSREYICQRLPCFVAHDKLPASLNISTICVLAAIDVNNALCWVLPASIKRCMVSIRFSHC